MAISMQWSCWSECARNQSASRARRPPATSQFLFGCHLLLGQRFAGHHEPDFVLALVRRPKNVAMQLHEVGRRFLRLLFGIKLKIANPPMTSLLSGKGPSVMVTLPSITRTSAPCEVGASPPVATSVLPVWPLLRPCRRRPSFPGAAVRPVPNLDRPS